MEEIFGLGQGGKGGGRGVVGGGVDGRGEVGGGRMVVVGGGWVHVFLVAKARGAVVLNGMLLRKSGPSLWRGSWEGRKKGGMEGVSVLSEE